MLARSLRFLVVQRPSSFSSSAPSLISCCSSRRIASAQSFAPYYSPHITLKIMSPDGIFRLSIARLSIARLSIAARGLSTEARDGGSTKHRSAILHASSTGSGASGEESKLIYRSPLTLIKIFRSLALVQTTGCMVGCSAMLWQVSHKAPKRAHPHPPVTRSTTASLAVAT